MGLAVGSHVCRLPPKAGSFTFTEGASACLMKCMNTLPDLARVSDDSVGGPVSGGPVWGLAGADLPCTAGRLPLGAPVCPGPAQGLRAWCLAHQTCTLLGE